MLNEMKMSSALERTGDPEQIVYVIRTTPDAADSPAVLPGETGAQLCVLVFNQPETARQFAHDYPDAQPGWTVMPITLGDLAALLQAQAQQGRTHVMVDPQVTAGPVFPAGVMPIADYVAEIS